MTALPDVVYRIDRADHITAVNEGWSSFARANAGEQLLPPGILGHPLWPWIADSTTRQVYRALLDRVRQGTSPVRFRFRCDAPDRRRLLSMQIAATADDEVAFETILLESQPRSVVDLMDPAIYRSDELLTICGWCMRIPAERGAWLEVEEAISVLRLFEAGALPRLSHGMCQRCHDAMLTTLDDPDLAASGQVTVGDLP